MSTTITLTNDFHNTSARVIPQPAAGGHHTISRAVARRRRSELCGAAGCTCGATFGEPRRYSLLECCGELGRKRRVST